MPVILVVDDDPLDRELAGRALRGVEALEVREARSAEEALEMLGSAAPDLVLTDLRMPGMSGLDLVRRARESAPGVPFVLMTSQGSEAVAVEALRAGASSYVPKHTIEESLADTVQQVLEMAAARRAQRRVLRYLDRSETRFELENDPALIPPFVALLQEIAEWLGFGDETVRAQLGVALLEAVSNAMVHGNLEVGSELRQGQPGAYRDAIAQRRVLEPYASRRVRCTVTHVAGRVEYAVRDEGPGFDVSRLPDPTAPENLLNLSGRGLLLIRTFMDRVEFEDGGTHLRMTRLDVASRPDRT